MDETGTYILSVTAGAVLCTLAMGIVGERGITTVLLRMLCGMIMASIIIRPLGQLTMPNLSAYLEELEDQVTEAVSAGTQHSRQALSTRINQETRAYIQDKAASLGMVVEVVVILTDGEIPVPVGVELVGEGSPAAKQMLSEFLSSELGIQKEDQIWK